MAIKNRHSTSFCRSVFYTLSLLLLVTLQTLTTQAIADSTDTPAPFADLRANASAGAVLAMATNEPLNLSPTSEYTTNPKIDLLAPSKQSEQWKIHESDTFEFGWHNHNIWIKHTVFNPNDKTQVFSIEFTTPLVSSIHLYQLKGGRDSLQPLYLNSTDHQKPTARLVMEPGEVTTLYWHIRHTGDVNFKIVAWHEPGYYQNQVRQQLIFGMTYGITTLITIISLFLFFASRNATYCYLALFSFASLLLFAQTDGYFYQFFPFAQAHKLRVFLGSVLLFLLSFNIFSRSFIRLKSWSVASNRGLIFFTGLSCISLLAAIVVSHSLFLQQIAFLVSFLCLTLIIIMSLYVFKEGFINGLFLAIAAILIVLGLSSLFSYLHLFPEADLSVSATANAILLSHFVLLAGSLLFFYRSQQEVLNGVKELVRISENKLKATTERYDQKLQEAMLAKTHDAAHIEQQAKSRFLTSMSHEIRTPMSGILGMTELLSDTVTEPTQKQYVRSLQQAGQNLLRVITELLDFSQIEAGKLALESRTFDLKRMLDDCNAIYSLRAQESNIDLKHQFPSKVDLLIKGDSEKLKQIVMNMLNFSGRLLESASSNVDEHIHSFDGGLDNAQLYTGNTNLKTKKLKFIVELLERQTVNSKEIKFATSFSAAHISEEDKTELKQLFHPQQDDMPEKNSYGLSLTVSREIIERMHGDFGLEFDDDGNSVTIWFSARFISPSDEERQAHEKSLFLANKSLVLITDSPVEREQIEQVTRKWSVRMAHYQSFEKLSEAEIEDASVIAIASNLLHKAHIKQIAQDAKAIVILHPEKSIPTEQELENIPVIGLLSSPIKPQQLLMVLRHSMQLVNESNHKVARVSASHLNDIPTHKPMRILIAEDNKVNRMVLTGLLKKLDLDAEIAENGEQACEMHNKNPYDLILMDCEMPVMDGFKAARKIRANESDQSRSPCKIIALSAHGDVEHRQAALNAGMNEFLSKPLKKSKLTAILDKFMADFNYHDSVY